MLTRSLRPVAQAAPRNLSVRTFASDEPFKVRRRYDLESQERGRPERAQGTVGPTMKDSPTVFERDRKIRHMQTSGHVPHLMTLGDLSRDEIKNLLRTAYIFKYLAKVSTRNNIIGSLKGQTIALLFSKRSTRTRVASETSAKQLGGHPMFLGSQDIQLGVNETLSDSAKVISSMVDGIMARVNGHEDIEALAKDSSVPVINALSDLYHPTQILADMLTLFETFTPEEPISEIVGLRTGVRKRQKYLESYMATNVDPTACLEGKRIAWVGDTNNILNEILVTLPRFHAHVAVASPKGYDKVDPRVWAKLEEAGTTGSVTLTNSPEEALKDADVIVTDTWTSMGQEDEKTARLEAFKGYQITNELVERSGAKPGWKFMHCLPRKQDEVDDEVFYGDRSLVFPEAENRKWTIMACFDTYFGKWVTA